MKLFKIGKHRLRSDLGWYPGNEFRLFSLELFSVQDDYPTGWRMIVLFQLQLGKFILGIYLSNGRNE